MEQTTAKRARILIFILCAVAVISAVFCVLILRSSKQGEQPVAEIYINGKLADSIPLNSVKETYRFTVDNESGSNMVEVRPGAIGIVSADCPDKICVKQGFITDSHLPVTCLPHRLVIRIRKEHETWD